MTAPLGRPPRVLFAASEAVGLAKTGGLADVAGSLPRALKRRGIDVRVVLPLYNAIRRAGLSIEPTGVELHIPVGPHVHHGRVLWTTLPNSEVPVYLIDLPQFFDRDDAAGRGLYQFTEAGGKRDYPDNAERFIAFSRAALEMLDGLNFWPDLVHANDWQSALMPVYLRELYGRWNHQYQPIRTLLTIHNIAYQGQFGPATMAQTGLDPSVLHYERLEFHGNLSFLKGGIVYSDFINTVSPRYAEEIQTPFFGNGLEGVLATRRDRLCGIVNGVDYDVWNPATDPHIPVRYDANSVFDHKPASKAALQRQFHLHERADAPLLGVVARLADQKGIDLILEAGEEILRRDTQLVILGEGDPHYHYWLQQLRDRFAERVGVYFGFSESLAHLIEAGADAFLMPSKYEPMGLNQLYSLRYGTVPIVRAVGGLYDTITDTNEETIRDGSATGFRFGPYSGPAFLGAVEHALHCYRHHPDVWRQLVRTGMAQDWSWDRSAADYEGLYRRMTGG
jgi:starch synthase